LQIKVSTQPEYGNVVELIMTSKGNWQNTMYCEVYCCTCLVLYIL